jgi:hypothetical protein
MFQTINYVFASLQLRVSHDSSLLGLDGSLLWLDCHHRTALGPCRSVGSVNGDGLPLPEQVKARVTAARDPVLVELGDHGALNVGDEKGWSLKRGSSWANDGGVGAVHVEFAVAGSVDPGPGNFEEEGGFDQSDRGADRVKDQESDTSAIESTLLKGYSQMQFSQAGRFLGMGTEYLRVLDMQLERTVRRTPQVTPLSYEMANWQ